MTRRTINSEEQKRRKAQKRFEDLDYTPLAAKFLSGIMRELAGRPEIHREARLRAFTEVARGK